MKLSKCADVNKILVDFILYHGIDSLSNCSIVNWIIFTLIWFESGIILNIWIRFEDLVEMPCSCWQGQNGETESMKTAPLGHFLVLDCEPKDKTVQPVPLTSLSKRCFVAVNNGNDIWRSFVQARSDQYGVESSVLRSAKRRMRWCCISVFW